MARAILDVSLTFVCLVPPAILLLMGAPMLLSPFTNEDLDLARYMLFAGPAYLGFLAAPGYIYALLDDTRATTLGSRAGIWVRTSLIAALVASVWTMALLGPAWPQLALLVLLASSATLTSGWLLYRLQSR